MKCISLSLLILASLSVASSHAATPFLKTLAESPGGVVVAYGDTTASQNAANLIRNAIRSIPGQASWDNLQAASTFDSQDRSVTGGSHVIAVGLLSDNVVLQGRGQLPTWWMDRDWYHSQSNESLSPQELGVPYMPTTGFVVGGFGEWLNSSKVGYVEVDRSHLFMEHMVRERNFVRGSMSPSYPMNFPLRLIVRVTGSGGDGVIAAANAFANDGLLNGVVLNGAVADTRPEMFALTADRYETGLPLTPPDNIDGYRYQGWLLPSAFEYDGFAKDARIKPVQMYRIKYKPNFGITNFWTSPHRRASQFEVCLAYFNSASDAQIAKDNLADRYEDEKTPTPRKGEFALLTSFNMQVKGSVLVLESLPPTATGTDLEILNQFLNQL